MAIDIVQQTMMIHEKLEQIILMDDYGAQVHLYISVGETADGRAAQVKNAIAMMQISQDNMEACATANGHDLTAAKTAGLATKAAMIAAMPPAMATKAQAVVSAAVVAISAASVKAVPAATAPAPAVSTTTP
jgi:hypothetical protein